MMQATVTLPNAERNRTLVVEIKGQLLPVPFKLRNDPFDDVDHHVRSC
jgi:hypothetical protein